MIILNIILIIIAAYLLIGVVFAIPFIMRGVTKIDEGAHGSKWGFRIIIIPGTIIFWPFLLRKWTGVSKTDKHD
jgi:hypothetical protein